MATRFKKKPEPRVLRPKKKSSNQTVRVTTVSVKDLNPYADNARAHSPKQVPQIKRPIEMFGNINPIIDDVFRKTVSLREGRKVKKVRPVEALFRRVMNDALKSNPKAVERQLHRNALL